MDVSLPIGVSGAKESAEQIAALNRDIVKLYTEGLNTRQPVENAKTLTRGLHAVGRELRDVINPALTSLGVTLGAGAFAASMIGITKAASDFAKATVEMGYVAKETGISIETMKGYAAAAQSHGISNEAAMASITAFGRKADDIRNNMSDLTATLVGWGESGLVQAIQHSRNNAEALAATLKRMDELREQAPDRARMLSEQLLGDYRFINMSLADVEKWAAMAVAPTKEQEEAARRFKQTTDELENAFDDVKQTLGIAVLPGFTKAMENLTKIYTDNPEALQPIIQGFEDAAKAIQRITSRDLTAAGRALGGAINLALKSASTIYKVLEWVASQHASKEEMEAPPPVPYKPWTWRMPSLGSVIGGMTGANAEMQANQQAEPFKDLSKHLDKTADLLREINIRNEMIRRGIIGGGGAATGGVAFPGGYTVGAGGPAANLPGFSPATPTGGPQALGPNTGAIGAGFVPGSGFGPGGGGPRAAGGDPSVVGQKRGGGGNVDAGALYKSYVSKFKGGPLDGYVPPDGPKWGINKGTPEEWAALALATSQQESGLNRYAGNGGLNQFNSGDLANYGLAGRRVDDPDAQAQALVNQWNKHIPQDQIIAGTNASGRWGGATRYFGSMRRRGETDKYVAWAKTIGAEVDAKNGPPSPPTQGASGGSGAILDWQGAMQRAREQQNPQASVGGSPSGFAKPQPPIIPDRTTAKGLPSYMLDDAIRDQDTPTSNKLHINVKVNAPKGKVDVKTNAQGDDIASVMQRREHAKTEEKQPTPQKAHEPEKATADVE
ncbi:hypothetical protein [Bradyrhizobium sp. USDA 313]|uniref:hypothetical protein n=1 Tax=Bradyrhizobium sp. USDA 313 TaxID=3156307 RepID=UPI0035120AE6